MANMDFAIKIDHKKISKVYSLIAEMEALKIEVEVLKREWPNYGEHLFQEKADQIRCIADELQQLGQENEDSKKEVYEK